MNVNDIKNDYELYKKEENELEKNTKRQNNK